MAGRIAFQGELGAYSHQACHDSYPDYEPVPCRTFEDVIEIVRKGDADLAMLPVENSTYGRVADIHRLLPESGLHIVGEAFVRVHINLLALPGTPLHRVERAQSHTVLLGQCRDFLRQHNIDPVTGADTAGSAQHVAELGDPALGALASELAGEIYGLQHTPDRFDERWLKPQTPIKKLYLTGQDVATAGVGGAMMGGVLCAVSILGKNMMTDIMTA